MDKTLLGELLVKARVINEKQLADALKMQQTHGERIGSALLKMHAVTEESLITFLSRQYSVPAINLTDFKFDPALARYLPYDVAKRYRMIPLMLAGGNLRIAVADPSNHMAIEDIKFTSGMNVSIYVAVESLIMDAIERLYPHSEKIKKPAVTAEKARPPKVRAEDVRAAMGETYEEVTVMAAANETDAAGDEQPVEKMMQGILVNAIKYRASDIHIEPAEDVLRVRYRIDGVLKPVLKLPVQMRSQLTARVKQQFRLDPAEMRMPQSGRLKLRFGAGKEIECRASTYPTLHGEKIVLKLVDRSLVPYDLSKLGFEEAQLELFRSAIERPQGLVLIAGPSDSGKTTTIYSSLLHLNKSGINIVTAEDPIEFNLFGTNQGQIDPGIGLTYPAALESLLRQDPDVIMLTELPDHETAELAVKSALTGRLVMSTLPANDSAGIITRLINMDIEPFAIASSIALAVSQRLVRKVCTACRTPQIYEDATLLKIGFPSDMLGDFYCQIGTGCEACQGTGFSGRTAIFEVMRPSPDIQELIMRNAPPAELKQKAILEGMLTLRQSGIKKVMDGITSVEELLRVTFED